MPALGLGALIVQELAPSVKAFITSRANPRLFRNIQQHSVGIRKYMLSYGASLQIFF